MVALDQPESDIIRFAPGEAPLSSSSMKTLSLKTKQGARALPIALAYPITVTTVELGEVIACGYSSWSTAIECAL